MKISKRFDNVWCSWSRNVVWAHADSSERRAWRDGINKSVRLERHSSRREKEKRALWRVAGFAVFSFSMRSLPKLLFSSRLGRFVDPRWRITWLCYQKTLKYLSCQFMNTCIVIQWTFYYGEGLMKHKKKTVQDLHVHLVYLGLPYATSRRERERKKERLYKTYFFNPFSLWNLSPGCYIFRKPFVGKESNSSENNARTYPVCFAEATPYEIPMVIELETDRFFSVLHFSVFNWA